MKLFVLLAAILAITIAKPVEPSVSLTQDTAGNYNLNYETEDSKRTERGSQDGKVVGSFTYKDTDGASHNINYAAGAETGYVAHGDVPEPVKETPEVAASRAAHLAVQEKERAILPPLKERH